MVYSKNLLSSPLVKLNRKILKSKTKQYERYLLFIGTLNRVKGVDLLASAFLKSLKNIKISHLKYQVE